jgi:hypothetical protein
MNGKKIKLNINDAFRTKQGMERGMPPSVPNAGFPSNQPFDRSALQTLISLCYAGYLAAEHQPVN